MNQPTKITITADEVVIDYKFTRESYSFTPSDKVAMATALYDLGVSKPAVEEISARLYHDR